MSTIEKEIPAEKEKKEVTKEDLLQYMKEGFGTINNSILQLNQSIVDLTNTLYAFFDILKGKKNKKKKLKLSLDNINNLNYDLHYESSTSSTRHSKTSDDGQPKININNLFKEKK